MTSLNCEYSKFILFVTLYTLFIDSTTFLLYSFDAKSQLLSFEAENDLKKEKNCKNTNHSSKWHCTAIKY